MNHNQAIKRCIAASLLLSTASFAATSPTLQGLYAGAEFGGSFAYANQTVQNNVNLQFSDLSFTSSEPYSLYASMVRSSATGAIFAGYGHTWNKFYLGGEIALSNAYYNMASSSTTGLSRTIDNAITVTSAKQINTQVNVSPTQFGLFLRPGVMLSPTSLLYGRIGTSFATITYSTNVTDTKILAETPTIISFPLMIPANKRTHRAALQLGTGLEQALNNQLTMRLDYLFSYYGKIRMSAVGSNNLDPFFLTGSSYQSVSINNQSIMLGLAYHFYG